MLQSMGSQRVGHNIATEQQPWIYPPLQHAVEKECAGKRNIGLIQVWGFLNTRKQRGKGAFVNGRTAIEFELCSL